MTQPQSSSETSISLTTRQSEAWAWLIDSADSLLSLLYGGAKGGGKSFFLCVWAYTYAKLLIKLFKIDKPLENPLIVGFIGRKRGVDFSNTTLQTWKRVIPSNRYHIREQAKQIVIDDKVAILFGGLDDQDNINKFNSGELVFAAIDQAEETDRSDVSVLEGALRLTYNGIQPKYRILYTANPAECWLKNEFDVREGASIKETLIAGQKIKCVYIPALFTDNPYLPDNYELTLGKAFGYDENLLAAYKRGDWSLARDSEFVITRGMLDALRLKTVLPKAEIWTAGCDPSLGGDECVMYVLKNGLKVAEKITHETNPMVIAGDFVEFCNSNVPEEYRKVAKMRNFDYAGIDSIGIGAGIAARCRDLGLAVRNINSSQKATDQRCYLVRDEVWLYFRESVQKNLIPPIEDYQIIEQITAFKFKTHKGLFKVLDKQGVKDKIGCSPDRGDAFAYAIYMIKFAETLQKSSEEIINLDEPEYDWRCA